MKKRFIAIGMMVLMTLSLSLGPAMAANEAPCYNDSYAQGSMDYFYRENTYYPGMFRDVPTRNYWASAAIGDSYEYGLMVGTDATHFMPKKSMSLAEAMTIVARIHATYYAVDADFSIIPGIPWYTVYEQYLIDQGIIQYDWASGRENDTATRGEFCYLLFNAIPYEEYEPINDIEDNAIPDVTLNETEYAEEIYSMFRAGVIAGVDENGTFMPYSQLRREQVAAITVRVIDSNTRIQLDLTPQEPNRPNPPTPAPPAIDDATSAGWSAYEAPFVTLDNGNMKVYIGENPAKLPTADEVVKSNYGFSWYLYGINDGYENGFYSVGIANGHVVAIGVEGQGWVCGNAVGGTRSANIGAPGSVTSKISYQVYTDQHENGITHGMILHKKAYHTSHCYTKEIIAGEEEMTFHLCNAFRVAHGVQPVEKSSQAWNSARRHSYDMATNNYFSHTNLVGENPGDRMHKQGIDWHYCAENISAGRKDGFESHNAWVNSLGHRKNLLNPRAEYLGVGGAFNGSSKYRIYWTQNFWA